MFQVDSKYNDRPRLFASNYNLKEKFDWVKNRILFPNTENKYLDYSEILLNSNLSITPKSELSIGFIGDLMPCNGKSISLSDEIKSFFRSCKYLVINLEGTISKNTRFLALSHDYQIIEKIRKLFPNQIIIVNTSNNHSADFGYRIYEQSNKALEDAGFIVIGSIEKPNLILDNLNFYSASYWSNQDCDYISRISFSNLFSKGQFSKKGFFNIFLTHWGYEMQAYPNKHQVIIAKRLINNWQAIIGNHPHCPQPIVKYNVGNTNSMVAYSLGNFCYGRNFSYHKFGKILKMSLVKDNLLSHFVLSKIEHINTEYQINSSSILIKTSSNFLFNNHF